jgi:hypothetical protein
MEGAGRGIAAQAVVTLSKARAPQANR